MKNKKKKKRIKQSQIQLPESTPMHATLCTMSTAETHRGGNSLLLLSVSPPCACLSPSLSHPRPTARRFSPSFGDSSRSISVWSFSNAFIQRAVSNSVVPIGSYRLAWLDLYTATVRSHACETTCERAVALRPNARVVPILFLLWPRRLRKRWKIWDTASRYAPLSFEFGRAERIGTTCTWCRT